jgi:hypothetical protein
LGKLNLDFYAISELFFFNLVTISIDDVDLNKPKSTLSLPLSVICENFKISVSSPIYSSSPSSEFSLISCFSRNDFSKATDRAGAYFLMMSSFDVSSRVGRALLTWNSLLYREMKSSSTYSPPL